MTTTTHLSKPLSPKKQALYDAILLAALNTFAQFGFDATSTRQIAAEAGMEQGHLSYYFKSKEELWRAVLLSFQVEFRAMIEQSIAAAPQGTGVERARAILPPFLRHFSDNAQLSRIMLQEFSIASARHDWVVDTFARPIWERLQPLFEQLEAEGALPGIGALPAYFAMVGAAVTTFGSSGEVHRLADADPLDTAFVDGLITFLMRGVGAA